jgi:sugar lactone lactonase YvrE
MMISGGNVTTLVQGGLGFTDGSGSTARMLPQGGLVWDGSALLVADAGNQRIRRVLPGADAASTRVQTWAGSGQVASADGSASAASFGLPLGMHRAADGTVYVIDAAAGALRAVR